MFNTVCKDAQFQLSNLAMSDFFNTTANTTYTSTTVTSYTNAPMAENSTTPTPEESYSFLQVSWPLIILVPFAAAMAYIAYISKSGKKPAVSTDNEQELIGIQSGDSEAQNQPKEKGTSETILNDNQQNYGACNSRLSI